MAGIFLSPFFQLHQLWLPKFDIAGYCDIPLPCYNHFSHFDFIVIFTIHFRLQTVMPTMILAPIFFILALSFLPPSHQQQNAAGFGIIRPTQQERQFIRGNRNLKLVLNNRCGNSRWFTVTRNQCPIAFIDPTFIYHQQVCNK